MALNVAFQMDPVESLNPAGDSTLVLGIEATKRGHKLWYYTPDKLSMCDGQIVARGFPVKFYDDATNYYELGDEEVIDLRDMDVVWLRQDPPFDMTYLTTTYILEQLSDDVLVVNDPASVRNLPEKLFPTLLSQYMPPTLVSADPAAIDHFRQQHHDIIIKPLYGYGGRSIFRIKQDDDNLHALLEHFFASSKEPLVVQRFVPEIADGDRRIILVDDKVAGCMGRMPAEGEIRANLRVGASAAKRELTAEQKALCDVLGPELKKYGLVFTGLDMIGDYLIEINITSPTGLVQMNELYGLSIESDIWDAVEARL
ncbi:MAG: glutathione synthase [Rickettsiales bacterium]